MRPEDIVEVGQKLQSCFIELPCGISLTGSELEFVAPVSLSGRSIDFRGENLIVKASPGEVEGDRLVLFEAATAESSLIAISLEGAEFQVALDKREGHAYPLVKHLRQRTTASYEGDVKESYLKLRKILTHFRSHSKGSLAKYRDKVENERVAGNTIGSRVLNKLLADEILFSEGNFYFLKPENVDRHLGVSWTALRAGTVSAKLADYLQSIVGPT